MTTSNLVLTHIINPQNSRALEREKKKKKDMNFLPFSPPENLFLSSIILERKECRLIKPTKVAFEPNQELVILTKTHNKILMYPS